MRACTCYGSIPDSRVGANGLANPRDFQTPVAAYEDKVYSPSTPAYPIPSLCL
jgi:hypothetical protein